MIELVEEEEVFTVLVDGGSIGTVWQMHYDKERSSGQMKIQSGAFRAWAAETADGERQWFSRQQEAIDWLVG